MIFLLVLAVVSLLALLNKRAVWLAAALCAGWGASFILEQADLYSWIPYVDAGVFWLLLFLPAGVSCSRRTLVLFLQGGVLIAHVAFWWCYAHDQYYGSAYFWTLFGAYVITMGVLASGNFDVRSFVGAVLQGARSLLDRSPRLGVARSSAATQGREEGR